VDCNTNSIPDECDIATGASADCDSNGIPDECETVSDGNRNGSPDSCDIASGRSQDCNRNGIADEVDLAPAPRFLAFPSVSSENVFNVVSLAVSDLDGDGDLDRIAVHPSFTCCQGPPGHSLPRDAHPAERAPHLEP
jgi:hypothetical protein